MTPLADRMAGKHTPGPWTYELDSCRECRESGTTEYTIVGPPGAYHGQFSEEADARLVAAAPDLYEALEVLLSFDGISARDKARAALAKARGEV